MFSNVGVYAQKTAKNFSPPIFWPLLAACEILVPQPGIEPVPPAVEGWSPNLWTAREFSLKPFLIPSIHPTTDVLGSDPHYHVAVAVAQALLSVS